MGERGKFTFVIPAFNEEDYLPATLESVLEIIKNSSRNGDIVVVDNNSTDNTAEIAASYGAKVIFEPVNQISRARNAGAQSCPESDYLIFLDADSTISPEILDEILRLLDSGKICGGGVLFEMEGRLGKFLAGCWSLIARLTMLSGGACIFCLNSAFKGSGGYNENIYAAEDVTFCRAIKKWGRTHKMKFTLIRKFRALTSDRKLKWYSKTELFCQFILIVLMPWRIRNRSKMKIWYERPEEKDTEVNRKS